MTRNTCLEPVPGKGTPCKPLDICSDDELVSRVREHGLGWKLALNELLGRHRDWLIRHCTSRLGNLHDGQDVTQQVMLRVWKAVDRFEGRSAFRTWLYSIAENQCRSFAIRRMRYIQTGHIGRLLDLSLDESGSDPSNCCAREEAVARALEGINSSAREVLLLRFFQECTLEEIAASLRIGLSAAKMRLYRSLVQFRDEYLLVTGTPGDCHV